MSKSKQHITHAKPEDLTRLFSHAIEAQSKKHLTRGRSVLALHDGKIVRVFPNGKIEDAFIDPEIISAGQPCTTRLKSDDTEEKSHKVVSVDGDIIEVTGEIVGIVRERGRNVTFRTSKAIKRLGVKSRASAKTNNKTRLVKAPKISRLTRRNNIATGD